MIACHILLEAKFVDQTLLIIIFVNYANSEVYHEICKIY